jgi:NIMA (never in mitosis gene a)-related kinase
LGSGTFGRVYLGRKGGKKYALKILPYETESEQEAADSEEQNLQELQGCPYLVKFVDSFIDVCFRFYLVAIIFDFLCKGNSMYLVMNFYEAGTLGSLIAVIQKHGLSITEDRVWKIISQFFIALAFMNKKNHAHRDVKDDNIFVDNMDNIVLGDLGSTKEASFNSKKLETALTGTPFIFNRLYFIFILFLEFLWHPKCLQDSFVFFFLISMKFDII